MNKEQVKQKILEEIKRENKMDGTQIGAFLFYVAKDYTDLNNPSHPYTLYKILSELEATGIIENSNRLPEQATLDQKIKSSRWRLK